nr:pyridoxamine 5'-phosphate oxidase family protein [Candidatus Sigynarchaeota archaeon]
MERQEIIDKAVQYLNGHRILTMATASKDGDPDATALEYASDGVDVYVSCRPDSRKVSNITENSRVFYEVHEDIEITKENVMKLKAIQVAATGRVIKPGDSDFDGSLAKMVKKFPVFSTLPKDSRVFLHFKPKKLWFLNYKQKFFHRDEVSFNE